MPKIRGIKPDLWTDEDFVELSPYARLLWIGLWNYACDNGHLQDKSKQIKMRVLPTDDVNCAELLREIEARGLISRDGGWITIPNLSHHQKPHKRWWSTCDKPGCELPEGASHAPINRGATVAPPKGNRGATADVDGDVMLKGSDGDSSDAKKPRRATQLPPDFKPTEHHTELAVSLGVDLMAEVDKFTDHHRAKGSTFKDWNSALNNWLRKSAEFRGTVRQLRPQQDPQGRLVLPPLPGNEWSGR